MSIHKILYIYPWATLGGVERVLLNRAIAFKNHDLDVRQDVYFLHRTAAGKIYEQAIERFGVSGFLSITTNPDFADYDCILVIDAPEVFGSIDERHAVFVECHTPYPDNRTYLRKLPSSVNGIIVPSDYFGDRIKTEVPEQFRSRIFRLRNCVPALSPEILEYGLSDLKCFNKRPIAYIGRTDYNKNTAEVIRIFSELRKRMGDHFLLMIAGPVMPDIDLTELARRYRVFDRLVLLPPVPFQNVACLLNLVRINQGVFFSASKGESFGLSAVEAMVHEIPMVLSDSHAHLVGEHDGLLYPVGDIDAAIDRFHAVFVDYAGAKKKVSALKQRYSEMAFIDDWKLLFGETWRDLRPSSARSAAC